MVEPEPPEPVPEDEPIVTVVVPVEVANVALPEYVAVMTCDPDVVEENVYVAEPLDSSRDDRDMYLTPLTPTCSVRGHGRGFSEDVA